MHLKSCSVITIDGPSGSGKGTIGNLLAKHLGWHFLDSGALYRALGMWARRQGVPLDDEKKLTELAESMPIEWKEGQTFLAGMEVTNQLMGEAVGELASKVAVFPRVRTALLGLQRQCARSPGLVADGRDMGTVVFPNATLKIFLQASPVERAKRRYQQLKNKGDNVSLPTILADITERDARDSARQVAPLLPAKEAVLLDTTHLSVAEVLERILQLLEEKVVRTR